MPLVSIILPTWNRAPLIGETIASIRAQTHADWELLVVDDGSDDDTEDRVRALGDARIRWLPQERTGRVGLLKNRAIAKARGAFLAFADSDDLWAPNKIEAQLLALRDHPQAGFSLTNGYNFRRPGQPIHYFYPQREGMLFDNILIPLFTSRVSAIMPSLLLHSTCLERSGTFREEGRFSDARFIVDLARQFPAVVLYEPLIYRRIHESNSIHERWKDNYTDGIQLIRECRRESILPPKIARESLFRLHLRCGEQYAARNAPLKALAQFGKAWRYLPFHMAPWKKSARTLIQLALRS